MGSSYIRCPSAGSLFLPAQSDNLLNDVVSPGNFSVGHFKIGRLPWRDIGCSSKALDYRVNALPNMSNFNYEKLPTPLLDMVESPIHLKNLSIEELKQLSAEIRWELMYLMSSFQRPFRASLGVVELTVALHYVFHAPMDKILWDVSEQTYAHKILTGRRSLMFTLKTKNGLSGDTSRAESEYDAFGSGHGCNSVSAGLGMAVARDFKGKKERIVAVISNRTTTAGQSYEAMSNAGYLDSNMVVILNDTRHSLQRNPEEGSKMSLNALSTTLSKLQSSKSFMKLRELAKGFTKKIGRGMHELAAKVDEYARGLIGPLGSTLFEEMGLYYIGPVDGHNVNDIIYVLQQVASLDSTGPVLIHVITQDNNIPNVMKSEPEIEHEHKGGDKSYIMPSIPWYMNINVSRSYSDVFVGALIAEAEKDEDIVVVHAGMELETSLQSFQKKFPNRFFNVGMAEQHAVTFSAGLSCGGLKPFCVIPSTFLQRAYDQVIHDVDVQKVPVKFVLSSAGLVGSDGPMKCGAFDISFMSCLPNMIVMAPADRDELVRMVAAAAIINDKPVCLRYPRGTAVGLDTPFCNEPRTQIGKGRILSEGKDIALLGYGVVVQNCLDASYLLTEFGIEVTVADARFCKPLDIDLVRQLCKNHKFLVTVEEGTVGGFGSHVAQFMALDGQLDGKIKWRPIVLPDNYIEHATPCEQLAMAGLTGHHIAATALSLLGRTRDALQLMC